MENRKKMQETLDSRQLLEQIENGSIVVDREIFDALPGDFFRAQMAAEGKISKQDFEAWIGDMRSLHWEGQIELLIDDEEYGRKFVDWDYIREAAEPEEWLSFLRDLPQYADEADWDKLIREGSDASWQRLYEVQPELVKKHYPQWSEKKD